MNGQRTSVFVRMIEHSMSCSTYPSSSLSCFTVIIVDSRVGSFCSLLQVSASRELPQATTCLPAWRASPSTSCTRYRPPAPAPAVAQQQVSSFLLPKASCAALGLVWNAGFFSMGEFLNPAANSSRSMVPADYQISLMLLSYNIAVPI